MVAGCLEALAERPDEHQLVAGLELAQPAGAGADVLEQEVELEAFGLGPSVARSTLKALGRNGRSLAPPPHLLAAESM